MIQGTAGSTVESKLTKLRGQRAKVDVLKGFPPMLRGEPLDVEELLALPARECLGFWRSLEYITSLFAVGDRSSPRKRDPTIHWNVGPEQIVYDQSPVEGAWVCALVRKLRGDDADLLLRSPTFADLFLKIGEGLDIENRADCQSASKVDQRSTSKTDQGSQAVFFV